MQSNPARLLALFIAPPHFSFAKIQSEGEAPPLWLKGIRHQSSAKKTPSQYSLFLFYYYLSKK
jgi:hypothetical protein